MKKKFLKQFCLAKISVLIIFICYLCYENNAPVTANVKDGYLDITKYDIGTIIRLDGIWKLKENAWIEENKAYKDKKVPEKWDTQEVRYGTYIISLNVVKGSRYAIKLPNYTGSFNVYVDNKLVKKSGKIGKNNEEAETSFKSQIVCFEAESNNIEIAIETSVGEHNKAGITRSVLFGEEETVEEYSRFKLLKSIVYIGILVGIGFCLIFVYGMNYQRIGYLYLSLFCLCCAVLLNNIDDSGIYLFFPNITYQNFMKVEYISWIGQIIAVILLIGSIYNPKKKLFNIILIMDSIYLMTILLLERRIFAYSEKIYILVTAINYIYVITCLYCFIKEKRDYARLFMLGIMGMYTGAMAEVVNVSLYFNTFPVMQNTFYSIGILCFLLCQLYILMARMEEAEANKKRMISMEIGFLQAQISPHFFFNVLNHIYYLMDTDSKLAKWVLINFCTFIRAKYRFDYRNNTVYTLREEIQFINSYVAIENVRLNNNIVLKCDIENEDILDSLILPMLIQPLVENSIKHGFCNKQLCIEIKVVMKEVKYHKNNIVIKVSDDGKGISKEILYTIKSKENENGIGVNNINYRLQSYYNSELKINSKLNQGTEVEMEISTEVNKKINKEVSKEV